MVNREYQLDQNRHSLCSLGRRQFFNRAGINVGLAALGTLLARDLRADVGRRPDPLAANPPHFGPRAKRMVFLEMNGGPPQLDMFDYKPKLRELSGQQVPASFTKGERFAFIQDDAKLLGSPYQFHQYGGAGMWMSDVVAQHMRFIADDICMIHSLHTDQFNHSPASLQLFTGFPRPGHPSLGSWLLYGLGNASDDLPGFVYMQSGRGGRCGMNCYGSGFLPSVYQGVQLRSEGEPVLYLNNPPGIDRQLRRQTIDTLGTLNAAEKQSIGDPEIDTRIAQYELAFRMQMSLPEIADVAAEPEHIRQMYGTEPGKSSFANNCLLARRLLERGVRFIQLNHGEWDLHGGGPLNLHEGLQKLCRETMQATAAFVKDLKQRGLLEDTLIVWGGEFGRTPMLEGAMGPTVGRDHHKTFTVWMAGGGVKPGFVHGATDEIGYWPIESPVHVHDLQATILHCLGLDHELLTYQYQGRDFRLTDVAGEVVNDVLM